MNTRKPRTHTLLLGVGLIAICGGMQGTLLALRGHLEGYAPAIIGIVMSAYYAGFLAGAWFVPRSVRLVGHIRVFAALGSFASITILLHATLVDPAWWTLLRALSGFCFSGLYLVAESWLNSVTANDKRGHTLGIYMGTISIGFMAGQFTVSLWPASGFEPFIIASVIISLAIVPLLLTRITSPRIRLNRHTDLITTLRASPLGFSTVFVQNMSAGALIWMTAVFARELGFSSGQSSALVAAIMLGGLITFVPLGRASDRLDRRHVLFVLSLLTIIGCLLVPPLATLGSFWMLAAIIMLIGGTCQPIYSVAVSLINDDQKTSAQVLSASSSIILVSGVGGLLGPLLTSLAMTAFGPGSLYFSVAGLGLISSLYTLLRMRKTPALDPAQQSEIAEIIMPTSQVNLVAAMDEADHHNEWEPTSTARPEASAPASSGTGAGQYLEQACRRTHKHHDLDVDVA